MFFKCQTKADCKTLFRKLAKRLHPDHGGEKDLMILLQESYEEKCFKLDELEKINQFSKKQKETEKKSENGIIENDDERTEIFDEMDLFYKENPDKQSKFYQSVRKYFKENEFITLKQYEALVSIYYNNNMGSSTWS